MEPINLYEFEELAAERLWKPAYDYYASGAHDEITLRENHAAYDRISLHYRVLVDVRERDLSTEVLGREISTPIMLAPTAFHRMAHADGELATARAASSAGTLMTLSTLSNTALEDVAAETAGPKWFQLYVYRDKEATLELIRRAEQAGFEALVFTVDAPYLGVRERDVRNEFNLPDDLQVANLTQRQMDQLPQAKLDSGLAAYFEDLLEQGLTWETFDWIASETDLPIILKGVVRPDDARRAIDHGVSGIVVSNHGGRQLDTSPATIDVLPSIARAVGSEIEVFIDGGIRRGTDVVKAVALGADAVLIGRPVLWGLAYDGQAGVERVLEILRDEFDLAMALCGARDVSELTRDLIGREA
jgi:4-hydroxymandelate oxidase